MVEGYLFFQKISFVLFQNHMINFPVAKPDVREIKYCAKGIDNTERVSIDGTCFEISSLCEGARNNNIVCTQINQAIRYLGYTLLCHN